VPIDAKMMVSESKGECMVDGIINVYKEAGFTSHDVVAVMRKILGTKKIGHTGTLDPAATGVLPVCVGNATKVCELITDKKKRYRAVVKLGIRTDTLDMTGEVLETDPSVEVTADDVRQAAVSFAGMYKQLPPMYSAVKVNGKKLYEYARKGQVVERKPREVYICDIAAYDYNDEAKEFMLEVECSKGTYIRVLCEDIGKKLGTVAVMKSLIRLRSGEFKIEDAHTLDQIRDAYGSMDEEDFANCYVIGVEEIFGEYGEIVLDAEQTKRLYNGGWFKCTQVGVPTVEGTRYRMKDSGGAFRAIYEVRGDVLKPEKMFLA